MKRQWYVRREAVVRPDAQGRWDQAYQDILQWSLELSESLLSWLAARLDSELQAWRSRPLEA